MFCLKLLLLGVWLGLISAVSTTDTEDSLMYDLSPDEINVFLSQKRIHQRSDQPFKPSTNGTSAPSTDLASLVDTAEDCIAHNEDHPRAGFNSRYTFIRAYCEWPGKNRRYFVVCRTLKVFAPDWPGGPPQVDEQSESTFAHWCPDNTVCIGTKGGEFVDHKTNPEDIDCVDTEEAKQIKFVAIKGKGHQQCSSSQQVPAGHYVDTWSTGVTDFVLTADLTWSNGKPYKAPSMFIRDESAKHPFDRAFRLNTDIVTATMQVGSYRGHLQSRLIKFCFEQLSGGSSWAVLSFAYFKASPRHSRGRIGDNPDSSANVTAL